MKILIIMLIGLSLLLVACTAPVEPKECKETWVCNEWNACTENKQTRDCNDINNCGTIKNQPEKVRETCKEDAYQEYNITQFDNPQNRFFVLLFNKMVSSLQER